MEKATNDQFTATITMRLTPVNRDKVYDGAALLSMKKAIGRRVLEGIASLLMKMLASQMKVITETESGMICELTSYKVQVVSGNGHETISLMDGRDIS